MEIHTKKGASFILLIFAILMSLKSIIFFLLPFSLFAFAGCGVYSFSGATIEGKTLNIHQLENKAQNVVPSLASTMTDKLRSRILSQTGLSPVNSDEADYDMAGNITGYNVTVTGATNVQVASTNRLTVSIQMTFKNRLNEKANFSQTFTRFADFPANQVLDNVQAALIDDIGNQIADDIFNKAFVNW